MKHSPFGSLFPLLIVVLSAGLTIGCQSAQQVGKKEGDDLNPALSATQRQALTQHKNRDQN